MTKLTPFQTRILATMRRVRQDYDRNVKGGYPTLTWAGIGSESVAERMDRNASGVPITSCVRVQNSMEKMADMGVITRHGVRFDLKESERITEDTTMATENWCILCKTNDGERVAFTGMTREWAERDAAAHNQREQRGRVWRAASEASVGFVPGKATTYDKWINAEREKGKA